MDTAHSIPLFHQKPWAGIFKLPRMHPPSKSILLRSITSRLATPRNDNICITRFRGMTAASALGSGNCACHGFSVVIVIRWYVLYFLKVLCDLSRLKMVHGASTKPKSETTGRAPSSTFQLRCRSYKYHSLSIVVDNYNCTQDV